MNTKKLKLQLLEELLESLDGSVVDKLKNRKNKTPVEVTEITEVVPLEAEGEECPMEEVEVVSKGNSLWDEEEEETNPFEGDDEKTNLLKRLFD